MSNLSHFDAVICLDISKAPLNGSISTDIACPIVDRANTLIRVTVAYLMNMHSATGSNIEILGVFAWVIRDCPEEVAALCFSEGRYHSLCTY